MNAISNNEIIIIFFHPFYYLLHVLTALFTPQINPALHKWQCAHFYIPVDDKEKIKLDHFSSNKTNLVVFLCCEGWPSLPKPGSPSFLLFLLKGCFFSSHCSQVLVHRGSLLGFLGFYITPGSLPYNKKKCSSTSYQNKVSNILVDKAVCDNDKSQCAKKTSLSSFFKLCYLIKQQFSSMIR